VSCQLFGGGERKTKKSEKKNHKIEKSHYGEFVHPRDLLRKKRDLIYFFGGGTESEELIVCQKKKPVIILFRKL